jgi:hypothetical protein
VLNFPKKVVTATSPAARPSAKGLSKGCPFGTVPIKRVRKEDLIGAKMFMEIKTLIQQRLRPLLAAYHVSHSFLIIIIPGWFIYLFLIIN